MTRAQLRAKRLAEVSKKVRKESLRVNAEFAAIETPAKLQPTRMPPAISPSLVNSRLCFLERLDKPRPHT